MRGRLMRVAVGILLALVVAAGCTDQSDDPRAGLLAGPPTTAGVTTTRDPSLPPPPTPTQIDAQFADAIAARDFCAVVATLDSQVPDVSDHAAVTETYRIVADSVKDATSFVPTELRDGWAAIVEATRLAAVEARRAEGDIADPSIQAQFSTSTFDDAYRDTIAWTVDNCA